MGPILRIAACALALVPLAGCMAGPGESIEGVDDTCVEQADDEPSVQVERDDVVDAGECPDARGRQRYGGE